MAPKKSYPGKTMTLRLQTLIAILVLIVFSLMAWKGYTYFFDTKIPQIALAGLEENKYYNGDIGCGISCNKSGKITISLDEQILTRNPENIKRNREYPFTIPTNALTHGKHTLKVEFVDSSYHKNKAIKTCPFNVDNLALQAALVQGDNDYKVLQGRTLHIQFQTNKEIQAAYVSALANKYPCFKEAKNSPIYECFVPVSCDETPNEYMFSVEISDKVGNTITLDNKFQVVLYPFKKETLHVSPEKVQEEKARGEDQQKLEEILAQLTEVSPREKLWHGTFCIPTDNVRITCDYGTIRTTQERGRYQHKAIDLVNTVTPRSVVWAPQGGVIAHMGRYATSGNSVVIDHGCGVLSLFFHLDGFADIKVGNKIAQGNPIGIIGKTGYATGYHLHWEMRVNNIPVDPIQWTKENF
jgi:murein DD-endopeptidase MepM/ murein hydrolase activator NlpD